MINQIINIMARGQYGQTYHALGKFPRKTLLERLGKRHAEKMYVDGENGEAEHIGYIIGGLWLTLYNVGKWVG